MQPSSHAARKGMEIEVQPVPRLLEAVQDTERSQVLTAND
jgi:hypothetical protein